jgi:hypothetical protein
MLKLNRSGATLDTLRPAISTHAVAGGQKAGGGRPVRLSDRWLEKVFGDTWTAQLEPDPDPKAHWRRRPRRR